jgi:TP901 family phage tail tape measure protein
VQQFDVLAVFRVVDNLTKPIDEMAKAVDGLKRSLEAVSQRFEALQNAGEKMAKFGAAISAPFAGAAYAAVEFEKTVVGEFNKVADLPKKQLGEFRKFFMELSTQIPLSANEIAQLSANLAQMGVPTDQLKQFTEMVAQAAFAFDMMADEAGKAFGEIRSAYGIKSVKELQAVGDTINYLSNTMGASARDLVEIVKRVSGVARQFGLSAKAVAVFGGVLRETGQQPEVAATAINFMLTRLQVLDDNMKEVLNTIGMTAEEFQELKKKSPEEALLRLLSAMKGLNEQTRAELLKKWVGQEHFGKVAVLINNLDRLKQKLNEIQLGKYAGSMGKEVQGLMQTTYAQFQLLKSQMQNLAISIGSVLIPPLKFFAETLSGVLKPLTDFIQAHQTLAKVIVYPAVGAGVLLTALGSLAATIGFLGKNILEGMAFITDFNKKLKESAFVANVTSVAFSRLTAVSSLRDAFSLAASAVAGFGRALFRVVLLNPYLLGLAAVGAAVYKFWEPLKELFKGLFAGIYEGFAEAFAPIVPILAPVIETVKRLFNWIGGLLKPVSDATGGFQTFYFAGKALGYALTYLFTPIRLLGRIFGWVSQGARWLADNWKRVLSIFAWTNPITAPIMALKKLVSFIRSINLFDAGKAIMEGLYNGIVSTMKKPLEAIKKVGSSIKEKFKSLLGISSPSRLFMEFGQFLNEGLGLGIVKSLGKVQEAVKKMASVLNLPEDKKLTVALETAVKASLPVATAITAAGVLATPAVGESSQPQINVTVTINNLVVGNRNDAPVVAKEIAGLTKAELERMLREIHEQKTRRTY